MEIRERFIKKRRKKLIKISFALYTNLRLATYGGKKEKI